MGEICWGGEITGEKLDGAEGIRGLGMSWMNRGEGRADGVRWVVLITYITEPRGDVIILGLGHYFWTIKKDLHDDLFTKSPFYVCINYFISYSSILNLRSQLINNFYDRPVSMLPHRH